MKITIYTINDCVYSQQEKDYLTSHNLQFEEKNLETNKDFLTEMLSISNNFAGTPVTKIEKDDGTVTIMKGFTAADFDAALGLPASAPAATTSAPAEVQAAAPAEAPVFEPPAVPETPVHEDAPVHEETPVTPAVTTPEVPAMPETPVMPEVPAMPEPPAAPVVPETPAAPVATSTPVSDEAMDSLLSKIQSKTADATPATPPQIPNPDFSKN